MSTPTSVPAGARVRTFHGRHGRVSDRMRRVLGEIGPRRTLEARAASDRPLVLEVGCGHGEAAIAFASAHPEADLVALDVHTPGIVHLLAVAEARGLPNVFAERGDAVELLEGRVDTAALAAVHLFFPDPWPKTRHHKRRFVREDLLDLLADRLGAGGELLIATDSAGYTRWALDHLAAHDAFSGGHADRPAWRPVTRYEAAAIGAGRPVSELRYRRP